MQVLLEILKSNTLDQYQEIVPKDNSSFFVHFQKSSMLQRHDKITRQQ